MSRSLRQNILLNEYFVISLFSAIPVLNFIAFNIGEENYSIVRSLIYVIAISGSGIFTLKLINFFLPDISTRFLAFFIGSFIFLTFNGYLIDSLVFGGFFENIGIQPRIRYIIFIYFFLILFLGVLSFLIIKKQEIVKIIMVGLCAVAIFEIFNIFKFIISYHTAADYSDINQQEISMQNTNNSENKINHQYGLESRPNVYFILPDMMFGQVMFQKYGINENILNVFENRDFEIIENAYANAPVTGFSLPHLFSMNHFLEDKMKINQGDMTKIFALYGYGSGDNNVYKEFRNRGYNTYALHDGYVPNCNRGEDVCLRDHEEGQFYQQQDFRFIERTPFVKTLDVLDMKYNLFDTPMNLWAYTERMEVPELIRVLDTNLDEPYFMYIHLGLPHYPFRFDSNCEYQRYDSLDIAYKEQYECTVKYLDLLTDKIIEKDKNALIVMHSDHGVSFPGQHLKQVGELTTPEIIENLSIFSAFRVPDNCDEHISDNISPVNTFRFVFACIDHKEPDFVEDKHFLVYYVKWPSGGHVREWKN